MSTKGTLACVEVISVRHVLKRCLFHIVAGSFPALALFLLPKFVVLIALAAATIILLLFETIRMRITSLNEWFYCFFAPLLREEEKKKITGSSYLLLGCLATVLVFPQDIAALAILFAAVGDPVATLSGVWKGGTRFWGRSVEGNIACFIVCLCIGVLVAILNDTPSLLVAVSGAVLATIFQALPIKLNDNLVIPFFSAAGMMIINIFL